MFQEVIKTTLSNRRQKVAFCVFTLLHAVAFLFYLIGTPLVQLKIRHVSDNQAKSCFTMWKFYPICSEHKNTMSISKQFNGVCPKRAKNFHAASAFAIISIFVLLATAACGAMKLLRFSFPRFICFALNLASIVLSSVPWILIAHIFTATDATPSLSTKSTDTSLCVALNNKNYYYGPGFILMVLAWIFIVLALPLVFVYNE